jgi:hypothetical protein
MEKMGIADYVFYSIPTRRELVKEAARNPTSSELKETQQEQQEWSWRNCPLSHKALARPVVSDSAGKLYNKDAIIEYLLPNEEDKSDKEEILGGRVKKLRDVIEVIFEVEDEDGKEEQWVCPVTRKILGPQVKAVYIAPCGHAFSEMAIKEVKGETCIQVRTSAAVHTSRTVLNEYLSVMNLTPPTTSSPYYQPFRRISNVLPLGGRRSSGKVSHTL